jgi:hypothetical protein
LSIKIFSSIVDFDKPNQPRTAAECRGNLIVLTQANAIIDTARFEKAARQSWS